MADDDPLPARRPRGAVLVALSLAAPRVRTADDHMRRPVAVATQTLHEGIGLTNGAEGYAAAVCERLCPGEDLPPLCVQR
jgi:hypothetical protein